MEKDFFDLYVRHRSLALEVGHDSVSDWNVLIYDKRRNRCGNWGDPVIHTSGCDRELVFADAYVKLAEYFSENMGGY